MPEVIDNPCFLYADDTKIIGNWFDLSSIQTDLNKVITWAAENRIDFDFNKFERIRFQKSNKRYPLSDFLPMVFGATLKFHGYTTSKKGLKKHTCNLITSEDLHQTH